MTEACFRQLCSYDWLPGSKENLHRKCQRVRGIDAQNSAIIMSLGLRAAARDECLLSGISPCSIKTTSLPYQPAQPTTNSTSSPSLTQTRTPHTPAMPHPRMKQCAVVNLDKPRPFHAASAPAEGTAPKQKGEMSSPQHLTEVPGQSTTGAIPLESGSNLLSCLAAAQSRTSVRATVSGNSHKK